jgi:hypothetical protein
VGWWEVIMFENIFDLTSNNFVEKKKIMNSGNLYEIIVTEL